MAAELAEMETEVLEAIDAIRPALQADGGVRTQAQFESQTGGEST